MKIEDIEKFKEWKDYTEEEKAVLPQLPKNITDKDDVPYWWNGHFWGYLEKD